jgi:hypothetical protein
MDSRLEGHLRGSLADQPGIGKFGAEILNGLPDKNCCDPGVLGTLITGKLNGNIR